jgi:phage gp46-like protein
MTDIAIVWDTAKARGDWQIVNGDLKAGSDLESAVLLSLFTDARASDDYVLPAGDDDPRGWWGTDYIGYEIGSRLWQYKRAKKAANTNLPASIQAECLRALQWLYDSGVAAGIAVTADWITPTAIGIAIVIAQPTGKPKNFTYSWAWQGV